MSLSVHMLLVAAIISTASAQYIATIYSTTDCTGTGTKATIALGCTNGILNGNPISESFREQTPSTTPALFTYNVYDTADCVGNPLVPFINVPVNGACVAAANSVMISMTVVPAPPSTTTTINVGAVVGSVLSVLFVTVAAVLFCRYKKVCCFAQPGSTPSAPPVMNPVGITVK